ncbi:MAG: hypothetical protein ACK4JB_22950 [Reyranella sp.]
MEKTRIEEFQDLFFARVMGDRRRNAEPEPLTVDRAQEGLFDLANALQQRFPPSGEADAKPVAEEALLEAIANMAEHGAMEAFAGMRPRLRRAVRVRLRTLLTVVVANEAASNARISFLPPGFPDEHVGMALLATMGVELPRDLRAKLE